MNATATTELYTLSLHDALPICTTVRKVRMLWQHDPRQPIGVWDELEEDAKGLKLKGRLALGTRLRSEEHTSELQSHVNLVCRLLLEKKTPSKRRRAACLVPRSS